MTAHARAAATRAALAAAMAWRALLWAAAAMAAMLATAGAADWAVGLPRPVRSAMLPAAVLLGAVTLLALLWSGRRVWALEAVALWVEERVPALRYALVTALGAPPGHAPPALERAVARVRWRGAVWRAAARAVLAPLAVLAAALAVGAVLPAGIVTRIAAPARGDALARAAPGAPEGARIAVIQVAITPPAYTREPPVRLDDPGTIAGLAGSAVRVRGRGAATGLGAHLEQEPLPVEGGDGEWVLVFAMPSRPAALRLRDGAAERIVALAPRADSAPVVALSMPARDTVLRVAAGALPLAARAADDYGLAAVWFEYIVSSGEGESFTFRSGVLHRSAARGARAARLSASLALDTLGLHAGDVVHVRAVAVDENGATGPDTGVSETRSLRIARRGEYDSTAVEGAPPPDVGRSELSERMLITLAQALDRRRAALARAVVVREAERLAVDQAALRRRVGTIIFVRLGRDVGAEESGVADPRGVLSPEALLRAADSAARPGGEALDFEADETPVVAVNRPLLEAYDAMWSAEGALRVGDPRGALPHMYAALAAIQRARQAERLYLHGRTAAVVVNLAKVRLAGSRDGVRAAPVAVAPALDTGAVRRAARLDAALALLPARPDAAADSLLLLRVDALEHAPALAAALDDAAAALRAGHDAGPAITRARRLAAQEPTTSSALPAWAGAW